MHVRLKILQGPSEGKEIKIPTPQCIIGREVGCHLQINNDAISDKHCVIVTSKNEVVVRDLSSHNGTFVNEQRIAGEVVLRNGDILSVGAKKFEIIIKPSRLKAWRPKFG